MQMISSNFSLAIPIFRKMGGTLPHCLLDFDRYRDGVDDAREFG